MSGDRHIAIAIRVFCPSCKFEMKLGGDVEHDIGSYVCDQCSSRVDVQVSISN